MGDSFIHPHAIKAYRTGLDSTMVHYLAVQEAMVNIHRPIHENHGTLLAYPANWPLYIFLENHGI